MNKVTVLRFVNRFLRSINRVRKLHLSHRQFIYVLALVIGVISGLYALLIVKTTVLVNRILMHGVFDKYSFFYYVFPALGLFFTFVIIKVFIRKSFNQGMAATLLSITNHGTFKEKMHPIISLITVPFTVGLGGSAGLEGPTVVSSASATAQIAKYFKLNQKTRVLLIGCAAVGAMSSLFKAPMAAIVFAIEVFALDFTLGSMIPLIISSITAILTSYFFNDTDILYPVRIIGEFSFSELPYYVLLGLFCGLASVFFTFFYTGTENFFKRFTKPMHKILLGGIIIGVIVFFFPPVFGEGAEQMNLMLRGEGEKLIENTYFERWNNPYILIAFILSISILKTIVTATTLGAGGVGGIFGPSLFIGCSIGNGFAKILNAIGFDVNEINFTLVGMAGLLAGVLHAPLTAIFLIAEISNGYTLIVPIMMVVVMAFAINRYYIQYPFYKMELAKRGELTTHDKDASIMRDIHLKEVIDVDYIALYDHQYLGDLVKNLHYSKKNLFPVLNEENDLVGVINASEIHHLLFDKAQYDTLQITEFMISPPEIIDFDKDNVESILKKFEESDSWILPVLRDDVFYGMVSKSKILNLYRNKLKEFDFD